MAQRKDNLNLLHNINRDRSSFGLPRHGGVLKMRPALKGESGFTLLETVLTLAILGMLLVIVLSAVRLGIRSWEKGEGLAEDVGSIRSLTARLSTDISSIYPSTHKGDEVIRSVFIGNEDTLGFVTAGGVERGAIQYGGTRWVYYSVRETGLTIREKATLSPDLTVDSGGWLIEIEPSVEKINFEYRGIEKWTNRWNADQEKGLPAVVRVSIFFKNEKVPLKVTVPVGTSLAKRV